MTENNAWMFSPNNPLGGAPSRTIADLDAEIERRRLSAKRERLSTGSNGLQQPHYISPSMSLTGGISSTSIMTSSIPVRPSLDRTFDTIQYPIASPNPPILSSPDNQRINKIESDLREERMKTFSLQQRIAQLERETEDQKMSIRRLADEKGDREEHINGLEEKNEDLENDLMLARQQLQSLSADNMTWREQNSTLRSRLQESLASKSIAEGVSQNQASIEQESYIAQYSVLEAHYNNLQQQHYEMQRELYDEKLRFDDACKESENLKEVAAQLDADVRSKEQRCANLAARVEELEETVVSMEREWERMSRHSVPVKLRDNNVPTLPSIAPAPSISAASSDDPNFRAPTPRDPSPPMREVEGMRRRNVGGNERNNSDSSSDGNNNGSKNIQQSDVPSQNGAQSVKQGSSGSVKMKPKRAGVIYLMFLLTFKSTLLVFLLAYVLVSFEVDTVLLSRLPAYLPLQAVHALFDGVRSLHGYFSITTQSIGDVNPANFGAYMQRLMAIKVSKRELLALVPSWEMFADLQRRVTDFLLNLER